MIETLRASYRDEATELLADLESALLDLERTPDDSESIARAFRAMHTIKGSGAMVDFGRIASFAHEVESVLDLVRNEKLAVTQPLITLTLEAKDHIKALLESEFGGPPVDEDDATRLLADFSKFSSIPGQNEAKPAEASAPQAAQSESEATYRIRWQPSRDIFQNGTNPLLLLRSLRKLGYCTVAAHTEGIPGLETFDPEQCYVSWDIVLTTTEDENEIRDVFIFVEDMSQLSIERVPLAATGEAPCPRIGELLVARGDLPEAELDSTLKKQKRLGQLLVEEGKVPADRVRSALAEQEHLKQVRDERGKAEASTSVRVKAEKLDGLVNTVGELVTAQARLAQLAAASANPEFEFAAEEIQRLIDRLRTDTMSIRMLPIGAMFARFHRLVRDLSRELGKNIELETDGAETELDKTVIDQLNDPLVHIIRNSIDHGIELPAARVAAGKPPEGRIRLSAEHSGAHVLLRISDDGAGLDRDAILAKAIERGLVTPGTELSEEQIFELIFKPGFSTAKEITSVSGRGVGLDVVQRAITALRGSIEVRSRKGEGTVFILKLPLTLAIIDGLLVTVGDGYYVMPVSNITECVELPQEQIARMGGRRVIAARDELVPFIPLREYFGLDTEPPEISQVMLAATEHGKVGFLVDRVIGDHQTVIKSLGKMYRHVESISGATILGDGGVALVLDLDKLVQEATRRA